MRLLTIAAACGMSLAAVAPTSAATPLAYDFSVTITTGPLTGDVYDGSFAFDASAITPGAFNPATGLLTELSFTFDGVTYNSLTANTGALEFGPSSALTFFIFGTSCDAGGCGVSSVTSEWSAQPGVDGFVYGYGYYAGVGLGDVSFAAIPEPSSWSLLGLGLMALAGLRDRTRGAAPRPAAAS
jgi:hypothetical protein